VTTREYLTKLIDARGHVAEALALVESTPVDQEDVTNARHALAEAKLHLLTAILWVDQRMDLVKPERPTEADYQDQRR
jgi:hypothetical protein